MINLICLIIFLLICTAVGRKIFRLIDFQFDSIGEELLFSIGLGFGIFSFLIFFLGITGVLYNWAIWIIIGISAIITFNELKSICISILRNILQIISARNSPIIIILVLILLGFVFINLISALTPVTGADPQAYHLSTPQKYLLNHKIYYIPDSSQSQLPMAVEMLYTIALTLKLPIFAKLIHFSLGVLMVLTIIIFSKRYLKNELIGILAAVIFYAQPVIERLSSMAKNDLGSTFFFLLLVFAFSNYYHNLETKNNKWLIVSSIFLGLTVCSKLTGIILFPMLFTAILLVNYKVKQSTWLISFGTAIVYIIISSLIVSPWFIKSYVYTGDPMYPFLSRLLSGTNLATTVHAHNSTILQYFMLPWDLTFNIDKFIYGNIHASPYFLAFLPILLFIRKKNKMILGLLSISILYVTFFFFQNITMRYILPALTLLSIVYAFSIVEFIGVINKQLRRVILVIIILPFLLSLAFTWNQNYFKIPVVLGMESQNSYLSKQLKGLHEICMYVNKNLPKESRIFSPWEVKGFYFEREFITGNSMFMKNFKGAKTCEELVKKVKRMGFTHILMNRNYHNNLLKMYKKNQIHIDPEENIFYKSCMKKYLQHMYTNNNVSIYKINS